MPSCLSLSASGGNKGGSTTLYNRLISLLFLASFLHLPFQCPKLCTSRGKYESCLHRVHLLECPRLWPPLLTPSINMLPYMLWFPEPEMSDSSIKTLENLGGMRSKRDQNLVFDLPSHLVCGYRFISS